MIQSSWLPEERVREFFSTQAHHMPVQLRPLAAARVLWLNRQVAQLDPVWHDHHGHQGKYEQALLSRCAFALASPNDGIEYAERPGLIAHADRYGGSGIGNNGGSGRAALVNGYLVKGIGPTPLIAANADRGHASGGAFLEEAIRECIYSEIVRHEFPHSAIPILAIIDVGVSQWLGGREGWAQRRVLVVRPAFFRPAHFERAQGYLGAQPSDGGADFARVQAAFQLAGPAHQLRHSFTEFFRRWSRQLAYAFAHRLPHGSNTLSNICLNGALLDFGAISTVPSWARVDTMLASQSLVSLDRHLAEFVWSVSYTLGRHLDGRYRESAFVRARVEEVRAVFKRTLAIEILRICGIERGAAASLMDSDAAQVVWQLLLDLLMYFQREHLDHVTECAPTRLPWDVASLWTEQVPAHLVPLRSWLEKQVSPARRSAAAVRNRWLAKSRPQLYREALKKTIFARLQSWGGHAEPRQY